MSSITLINLKDLSDDTLRNLRAYWYRRLQSRGGGWLAVIMQTAAVEQMGEIDAEMKRRGISTFERNSYQSDT